MRVLVGRGGGGGLEGGLHVGLLSSGLSRE